MDFSGWRAFCIPFIRKEHSKEMGREGVSVCSMETGEEVAYTNPNDRLEVDVFGDFDVLLTRRFLCVLFVECFVAFPVVCFDVCLKGWVNTEVPW
jgi:hypothetical protein